MKFFTKCKIYLLSLCLPIFILGLIFALFGIYPFGNSTILKGDLFHQYIHFYSYLYDAVKGDESLLYNWYSGLGTNYIGNFTYYTASPFLLILFLFEKTYLAEAAMVIIILKTGTAGLAGSIFIKKKFSSLTSLEIILFSTFYALMSYNIVYYYNVMWLDGLIWLPLLLVSTDLLIYKRRISWFVLCLTVLFISNFYIAYIVGLFIFLYFLSEVLQNKNNLAMAEKRQISFKFIISTLIAAGMASVLILPTFMQLLHTQKVSENLGFMPNFNVLNLVFKLFSGSFDSVKDGTPNVFIGTFVWLLTPVFFLSRRISKAEKIRWGIILLFLFISMEIPILDFVWHAFDVPNGWPYRYSFIFSFVLLFVSVKAYQHIETIRIQQVTIVYLITIGMILLNLIFHENIIINHTYNIICVSLFFIFLILKIKKYKRSAFMNFIIILYALMELTYNTGALYNKLTEDIGWISKEYYRGYQDYSGAIEKLELGNQGNYGRVNTDLNYTLNDSVHLGYSSFNYFSSMLNGNLSRTLKALGFSTRDISYNENGSTFVTNSLLGNKYLVTSEPINQYGYSQIDSYKGLYIYENIHALPMGYLVNQNIIELRPKEENNPFELQNSILNSLTEIKTKLFKPVLPAKIEYINAKVKGKRKQHHLERKDKSQPIKIKYEFFINNQKKFYALLKTSSEINNSEVLVNNQVIAEYPSRDNKGILELGTFKNEEAAIAFKVDQNEINITNELFYIADLNQYPQLKNRINRGSFQIKKIKGNKMTGNIYVNEEKAMMLLSIPWDEGWSIKVDGRVTKPIKILGSFMGIPLNKGEHEVELLFIPNGLTIGFCLSMISFIIFICIISFEWFKRKDYHQR